jgi:hypothetical protein
MVARNYIQFRQMIKTVIRYLELQHWNEKSTHLNFKEGTGLN